MKKRLLSWLMVLTLCLTLLPTAALAVDGEEQGGTGGESEGGTTTEEHKHYLCGGKDESGNSYTCPENCEETEQTPFTAWSETTSLPDTAGNYYLTGPVTLSEMWVPADGTVLCLNGQTVTANFSGTAAIKVRYGRAFTLTDCQNNTGKVTHAEGMTGRGVWVENSNVNDGSGRFVMYGGSISGNTVEDDIGSGVFVGAQGIFTMYGGTISGNTAQRGTNSAISSLISCGGGVYIFWDANGAGTFNMYGGSIADNKSGNFGGGVYMAKDGTFTMSGDASITGNTAGIDGGGVYMSRDNASTFHMSGNAKITGNSCGWTYQGAGVYVGISGDFTVSGNVQVTGNHRANGGLDNNVLLYSDSTIPTRSRIKINGLTDQAKIGVTLFYSDVDRIVATGAKSGDESCFESDLDDCYIAYEDSTLVLKEGTPTPPVGEEHEHYLCGGNGCTEVGGHSCTEVEFAEITNLEGLKNAAANGGNYYLKNSIELTETLAITRDLTLCLNGKSITMSGDADCVIKFAQARGGASAPTLDLTDCKNSGTITHVSGNGGGVYMNDNNATFNLYGGSITGNTGSGVYVTQYNTFNLYGGSITGNSANYGGGVNVSGTVNMYGGSITGNSANYGGGVYVEGAQDGYLGGILTVSGAAKITGNKVGEANNNVYLPKANQNLIYVIGALTGDAEIGVTPENWPAGNGEVAIATGMDAATGKIRYRMTEDDKVCFKSDNSDNSDYEISLNKSSNVLVLTKKGSTPTEKIDPTYTAPTAKSGLTYNGQPQELINAGSATGGEMQYKLGDGAYSTDIPTATNAGTYTVYYRVVGDETHNDVAEQSITITIAEKSVDPTPSTPSSSGSSSSGPRIIKTETRTAPDGSVTKTETWSDGTVTETTTGKDGSTAKTTTRKDGSSVTESKDANGTTGTVKTDKNGKTEAAAKVSEKAVEDAKKSGEAVKVPTEVKAGEDSNSAPTVKVELPKNAGETKIEIPVSDANSGTVAVIVHPDGTEELVKDSVPTEDGVQLVVDGSATVKIIDNSKDFIDTRDHWSRDEVNFVVARELFNGVGNNLFGVNQPMTRGMVNTVLARLAGVDTTPKNGQKWYEVGTEWAKANGISDGTNPEASVTREQLATLLYRFSGSPAVSGTLSFADAGAVSDYAQSALLWAVQNGILNGVGNNRVAPGADAQRAQVAAMMARYLRNVG